MLFQGLTSQTPLDYAVLFLPDQVGRLLKQGEDATIGTPLAYAAWYRRTHLIQPLLDAKADVNAVDWRGMTALHRACDTGNFEFFSTLVQFAGDEIDWGIRTPEGKTALGLLYESFRLDGWHYLLPSEREEFFSILRAYIPDEVDNEDEPLCMLGAFI